MNLKVVSANWTGVHEDARQDVVYKVGEITEAPDWDPEPKCGGGLHYAANSLDYLPETPEGGHLLEVERVGEVVRVEGEKSKTNRLRVIREITAVPTPEEESSAAVRYWVAKRIPAERIDHIPTPDEEPNEDVRWWMAQHIPAERIDHLPTPDEEPDAKVRYRVASRIPAKHINHLLTPWEEPDEGVRRCVARRIPVERLDHLSTPAEEPAVGVRWWVAERISTERIDHLLTPEEEPDADIRRMVEKRLKDMFVGVDGSYTERRKTKTIILEGLKAELDTHFGSSQKDRAARIALLKKHFGTASSTKIEGLDIDQLRLGYDKIWVELNPLREV